MVILTCEELVAVVSEINVVAVVSEIDVVVVVSLARRQDELNGQVRSKTLFLVSCRELEIKYYSQKNYIKISIFQFCFQV